MGRACCADRRTETGVQERPRLWCVVLTKRAKALLLILYQCWVDMSLDIKAADCLLKIRINFSQLSESSICWEHSSTCLYFYARSVINSL